MGHSVTLILRDGTYPDIKTDVIGVDAGAAYAISHHLKLICAVGDFDSIAPEILKDLKLQCPVFQFPPQKDQPDSQLAVEKALEIGYDEITMYGALGGRYDHHHANLVLAYLHHEVTLIDEQHWIKGFGPGVYGIKKESHEKLSVFTFESAVISLFNTEYPLDHYPIDGKTILGLSNTFLSKEVILTVHMGRVLIYCTKA